MTERRRKDASFDAVEGERRDRDDEDTKKEGKAPMIIFAVILFLCALFFATVGSPASNKAREVVSISTPKPLEAVVIAPPVDTDQQQLRGSSSVIVSDTPVPTLTKLREMALLNKEALRLIEETRKMKWSGVVMETDEKAIQLTSQLQSELRKLLTMRFGENPTILVEMMVKFPPSMPDFAEKGAEGRMVIEMGPIAHVPYSVYNFLEIARRFKSGAFHRNAGHVEQAMVNLANLGATDHFHGGGSLAFQEYSPLFPHRQFTMGYAGRPGGPAFYISQVDNTANHGPASQGSKTEADGCFGRLADDASKAVARRMNLQPGAEKGAGFISNPANFIVIQSVRVISPTDAGADVHLENVW